MAAAATRRHPRTILQLIGGALLLCLVATAPASAATITVTNNADAGAGSLRDAITTANATIELDEIEFAPAIGDIVLQSALPSITSSVHIGSAGGSQVIARDPGAGGAVRIFTFDTPGTVHEVRGVEIRDGNQTQNSVVPRVGGGAYVGTAVTVTFSDCHFEGNSVQSLNTVNNIDPDLSRSVARGGAIYSQGVLVVEDCTFHNNAATANSRRESITEGGSIYASGSLRVDDSTFSFEYEDGGFSSNVSAYSTNVTAVAGTIRAVGGAIATSDTASQVELRDLTISGIRTEAQSFAPASSRPTIEGGALSIRGANVPVLERIAITETSTSALATAWPLGADDAVTAPDVVIRGNDLFVRGGARSATS